MSLLVLFPSDNESTDKRGPVVWLMEPQRRNISTDAISTLYWSSGPILPFPPSDGDRPNQAYNPVIKHPGQYGRFLFAQGSIDDNSPRSEDGGIQVYNANGEFNDLRLNYSQDGRPINIYRGYQNYQTFNQFTLFLAGIQLKIFFDLSKSAVPTIDIDLADKSQVLNNTYQRMKYLGTNSGATGVEGLATDIAGKPKERAFGPIFNAPATPVNTSDLTFSLNGGSGINSVTAVRDNGATIAVDTTADYATLALLKAATITAARYATCLAEGYLRLGSSPAGQVCVDFTGTKTTNQILQSETIDNASWTKNQTTITANAINGPDAALTADKICEDNSNNVHNITQNVTIGSTQTFTISGMFKSAERTKVRLRAVNNGGTAGSFSVIADLSAGTVTTATTGTATLVTSTIVALSNGWYRVSVSGSLAAAVVSATIFTDLTTDGSTFSYAGTTGSGLYATKYQLVFGPRPLPYVVTTSGTASSYPTKTADIIRAILDDGTLSYDSNLYSTSDFTTVNAAAPYDMSMFIPAEETTTWAVIAELAASIGAAWYHDLSGVFRLKVLVDPGTQTSIYELVEKAQVDITRITPNPGASNTAKSMDNRGTTGTGIGVTPVGTTIIGYKKNYAIQPGDGLAGAATAATRASLAQDYILTPTSDTAVQADYLLYTTYIRNTLIYNSADAITERNRLQTLLGVVRDFIQVEVDYDDDTSTLDLGGVIKLTSARAGYPSGRNAYIIGISENNSRPGRRLLELFL